MKQELVAWMNGQKVGVLTKHKNGAHTFEYFSGWLSNPLARPVSLSLPLQLSTLTTPAVYNFFDNLLPDSPKVRDRIVARYRVKTDQPFDLLKEIGRDSVGAIMLLDVEHNSPDLTVNYEVLSAARLEQVLSAYKIDIPLGMIREEEDFRISVAGAQEKTALLKTSSGWAIPQGPTPTTHILKLPIGEIKQPAATLDMSQSVENEYFCLLMARELGFEVPTATIVDAGSIRALAVERFDRRWVDGGRALLRLPQEDMCQALGLPSSVKYESDGGPGIKDIMQILMGSSNAIEDQYNFMKFQVFQWVMGATDGHAKNFSLFIERGGSYRLTPFYDILSAYPLINGAGLNIRKLKLSMGLKATKGKKEAIYDIQPRHFLATAKSVQFSVERMNQILMFFVQEFDAAVIRVKSALPHNFPVKIVEPIVANAEKMMQRLKSWSVEGDER
ncbi:HipA domain-containing protein [Pantoea sp. A4]|uniref:HipA domain-containing protein n=1 Tax=Pantoea sp. A4 TaxID=1225184 RepID=UPI0003801B78